MAAWREPQDEPTPEQQATMRHWVPRRCEIAAEEKRIRAENEARQRQGKAYQPPVDECEAELEAEADRECGG